MPAAVMKETSNGLPKVTNGTHTNGDPIPERVSKGYIKERRTSQANNSLVFTIKEGVGQLAKTLQIFTDNNINLHHIESRSSQKIKDAYEFIVNFDSASGGDLRACLEKIKEKAEHVTLCTREKISKQLSEEVPWFPRRIEDLDLFANHILSYGSELSADHPGFTDEAYRARRKEVADIAFNYKHGQEIPQVAYNEKEIETWRTVYKELTKKYPTHACREHNQECDANEILASWKEQQQEKISSKDKKKKACFVCAHGRMRVFDNDPDSTHHQMFRFMYSTQF